MALAGGILFSQTVYAGSLDELFPVPQTGIGQSPANKTEGKQNGNNESAADKKQPKTLLEWILGSEGQEEEGKGPEEEKRLDPDRPHFPEASTTVGKGRIVLESGYTFTKKGSSFVSHSRPEAVLRLGMFADWFEFRIGQNSVNEEHSVAGTTTRARGAQDLYLGVKLALTEQKKYLPEIALIPQMTVPTGSRAVTAGRVLAGLNVDSGWEVIKELFNIELLIATNRVRDDILRSHVEVATGLTFAVNVRRDLEAFVEWDAFYPVGKSGFATSARHYGVGGFVYFITNNLAVDIRAGVGLNREANDLLAGTGFSVRY